jgi:hypothetical protein
MYCKDVEGTVVALLYRHFLALTEERRYSEFLVCEVAVGLGSSEVRSGITTWCCAKQSVWSIVAVRIKRLWIENSLYWVWGRGEREQYIPLCLIFIFYCPVTYVRKRDWHIEWNFCYSDVSGRCGNWLNSESKRNARPLSDGWWVISNMHLSLFLSKIWPFIVSMGWKHGNRFLYALFCFHEERSTAFF